jgi:phospholipid transport system substrate-binding protein
MESHRNRGHFRPKEWNLGFESTSLRQRISSSSSSVCYLITLFAPRQWNRSAALPRMARASLGDHWNELTTAERDELVSLFGAFIEAAYLTQIQNYVELNIAVSKERYAGPNYALVDATMIQPHEDDLPISFMLERRGNDWFVYDVEVEDVRMIENYCTQFDRVIREQGLVHLLNDLRAKQKQLAELIGKL